MIVETLWLVSTSSHRSSICLTHGFCNNLDLTSEARGHVEDVCAVDSMPSNQDISERIIPQSAGIGGEVLHRDANLRLSLEGMCIDQLKRLILKVVNHQTCDFNAQRRGPTLHPLTRSSWSFSDLQPRRGRFYRWNGTRQRRGSRHHLSNCKHLVANILPISALTAFQKRGCGQLQNCGYI